MSNLLKQLRADAGGRTLGELIQEREAAAQEIERLMSQLAEHRSRSPVAVHQTKSPVVPAVGSGVHWQDRALLRLSEVSQIVGISRSTVYGRMADGTFPRPVQVSERSVRWRSADIAAWLSDLSRS